MTIDGRCELVGNGPIADGLVLPIHSPDGMKFCVLPGNTKGVSLSGPVLTLGLRACPVADASADRARVPGEAMIHPGTAISLSAVYSLFSGPVAALCAGICRCSLKKASAYIKERRQGGRILAEYSQLRMMISSMTERYQTACVAAERLSEAGGLKGADDTALFVSARDGVARAAQDGVQLLGGYGYMEEYGQERCMRDAKQAQMMLGRDDLRRLELAAVSLE
jgi:alkylation response protein AidB-like acyl-CoA dehydrogenase